MRWIQEVWPQVTSILSTQDWRSRATQSSLQQAPRKCRVWQKQHFTRFQSLYFFPLTFKATLPVIVTVSKKKKKEKKDCLQREFIPTGRERNPNAPRIEARMTGKMSNKLAQTKSTFKDRFCSSL